MTVDEEVQYRIQHPTLAMRVAHACSDLLYRVPENPDSWRNSLPEAFGAVNEHGEVYIIGYLGEWYVPVRPGLRVRLRNLFVGYYNRKVGGDDL